MSFDLTSRNKDYKSLDSRTKEVGHGSNGSNAFYYYGTRRIIMYDELLYCIVSKYLYTRYKI